MREEDAKVIKEKYMKGLNSIQDLARIYRYTVDEVLDVIGEQHLKTVRFGGDLVDTEEAGSNAQINYGEVKKVPFSLN